MVPDLKTRTSTVQTIPQPKSPVRLGHPHFVFAVAAQFLYVAAQAGIFSFFINYMTSQARDSRKLEFGLARLADHASFLQTWLSGWFGER